MNRIWIRTLCGALVLLLLMGVAACDAPGATEDTQNTGAATTELGTETQSGTQTEQGTEQSTEKNTEQATEQNTEQKTEPETQTDAPATDAPTTEPETQEPEEQATIVVPGENGYTYPMLQEDLAALAETYPELFSYMTIGKSVDERGIFACTVGNPNAERKILLTGGIHGKEYLSSLLVMTQIEYYLSNAESGSYNGLSYAQMLQECVFYVLPMINPDGIMLALEGIDSMQTAEARGTVEKIYADNLRDGLTTASDINVYLAYNWKANANGVDLNRNFALSNWADVKTGILAPCFRNYKGPSAASEPETRAVSAYVESLGELEALLSFHTAGQVVYWDCGMTGTVRQQTFDLAKAVCEHTGYKLIYDEHLDASLNDWITLEKGVPSLTIEIATVIYPMPTSELELAFAQTKELWAVAAQFFG